MGKRIMGFYGRLFSQPPCVVFGLVFVAVKIWSNVAYGGSAFNGLRSGLVGLLVYGLALGVIYLLSDKPRLERFGISRLGKRENGVALLVMGALYLIMAAAIVDRLQRLGKMPGAPCCRLFQAGPVGIVIGKASPLVTPGQTCSGASPFKC